eukprot:TRINITY_DN817_c0_g1_i1.p2 TRINITY_DN817_c0_g1~~TRINITY_DN817_c0_g1_i1.p2  ORF type:complete len:107 (-),score=6.36 TRINITY_DN817_c0_g1_i1:145-465(-)
MNANEILERRKLQRINQNHEEQQTERSNRKPSFSNPVNSEKDLPKEKIQAENEPKEDSPRTIHLRWEKMRVQWMNVKLLIILRKRKLKEILHINVPRDQFLRKNES